MYSRSTRLTHKNSFAKSFACSLTLAALASLPASASVIATTGPIIEISPPSSVVPGNNVNTQDAQEFDEQQGVMLTSNLLVSATAPGTYINGVGSGGQIAAGTDVNSNFVFFDSGGTPDRYGTVSLTFSSPILGVIFSSSKLNASDGILGDAGTAYPYGLPARGQENGDSTNISSNGYTITLSDVTYYPGDEIRVITAGAPEPTTVALFGLGALGAGVFQWRRRRKASA